MEIDIDQVYTAIDALYCCNDPNAANNKKAKEASEWLGQLQRSILAWKVGDQLLILKRDLNSCFFAAQTLRTKIQYYFAELPSEAHESFRLSMMNHIRQITPGTVPGISTQLCVGLADLALLLTSWVDPIGDLITEFGPNSTNPNLGALLEVLLALPEEDKYSKHLRLGQNRRMELEDYLQTQIPVIVQLLHTIVSSQIDENTHLKVLRCLGAWFIVQSQEWSVITNTCILEDLNNVVKNPHLSTRMHEVGTDCVCAALYMLQFQPVPSLAAALFATVLQLEGAYHAAVGAEDLSAVTNYARMFAESGETLVHVIVNQRAQNVESQQILQLLLTCVGHHEWEVAEITFNFWYKLSEILYNANDDNLTLHFSPYIERLIEALYKHCQIDADHEGILPEQLDFCEFRERVEELIKDVAFICGGKTFFIQMASILRESGANTPWNEMEAALFVMQSIAKNMLPSENEHVPPVMEAILSQPDAIHIQVAHTSILVVSELNEWLTSHEAIIPRVLTFLTKKLSNPDLATVAARALDAVCRACCDSLFDHFDGLMSVATSLDSYRVSNEAVVGLLKGISSIMGKMPPDKIQRYMKSLCAVQVNGLESILRGRSSDSKNPTTDPTIWLDRLSAIFRSVNIQTSENEVHACQAVVMDIWPTLRLTFQAYMQDVRVMEHCCRCIRFAVRCVHQQSAPLLPELVDLIVNHYAQTGFSCFVYLGSILVDEYASLEGCLDGLLRMLQAFMQPTFALLSKPNGFKDHPDTVDDWFRLCTRFLQRAPIPFLQCNVIESILMCGLQAAMLDHKDANCAVLKFFRDLIETGIKDDDKADFEMRRNIVKGIFERNGQTLVDNLITSALFILPSYMLREVAETLYSALTFDRMKFCGMLETKLKTLPQKNAAGLPTVNHQQLVGVHRTITKATKSKDIYKCLVEFAKYFT